MNTFCHLGLLGNLAADMEMPPKSFPCSVVELIALPVILMAPTHEYTHAGMHVGMHACPFEAFGVSCGEPIAPQLRSAFLLHVRRRIPSF